MCRVYMRTHKKANLPLDNLCAYVHTHSVMSVRTDNSKRLSVEFDASTHGARLRGTALSGSPSCGRRKGRA